MLVVDDLVLTTPAFTAADLVSALSPAAAQALRGIEYVDVATVMLAYDRADVAHALSGTGFLVPPVDGRLLVGCSWLTSKWGHLTHDDQVVIRAMVGRHGDDRFTAYDDDGLVAAIEAELAESTGVAGAPKQVHVQRWPAAMPQYTVGHAARLAQIDDALAVLPGLHLTGAAYRGVGLAGCIAQAARTAAMVRERAHVLDIPTAAR